MTNIFCPLFIWNSSPIDYLHSSANFYLGGSHIIYPIVHVMNMKDINFDKRIK